MKDRLLERFLRYVLYDTTSDPASDSYPSTACQLRLLNDLTAELAQIGCTDVGIDEWGYVTATVEASAGCENEPTIGLFAHVDTSPDMSGTEVKAQVHDNYNPSLELKLNEQYSLDVQKFPELRMFAGHTLITTDGTTLLGADDKAGVAQIMTAAEWLIENPDVRHGRVRICFTPDEEIGRGVDHFDVAAFGADFAYTIDSGVEGSMEWENFNAAGATVEIFGRNFHPGYAKDRMINALQVAINIHIMLPIWERPEKTDGMAGFFHLHAMSGDVEHARMEYLIRDHDRQEFERKKSRLAELVKDVNEKCGEQVARLTVADQYYNMGDVIARTPEVVERARTAIVGAGLTPRVEPIRGGTDGARLSWMGLPCPNIFTGGMNPHSRFEYASLDSMEKAVHTIINLVSTNSKTIMRPQ